MPSVIDGSDNFDSGYGLGVGQSWQEMVSERDFDTIYTNDTTKPIMINITASAIGILDAALMSGLVLLANPYNGSGGSDGSWMVYSAIIPSGARYSLVHLDGDDPSLENWAELRGV